MKNATSCAIMGDMFMVRVRFTRRTGTQHCNYSATSMRQLQRQQTRTMNMSPMMAHEVAFFIAQPAESRAVVTRDVQRGNRHENQLLRTVLPHPQHINSTTLRSAHA